MLFPVNVPLCNRKSDRELAQSCHVDLHGVFDYRSGLIPSLNYSSKFSKRFMSYQFIIAELDVQGTGLYYYVCLDVCKVLDESG